jgi:hypothetical protein
MPIKKGDLGRLVIPIVIGPHVFEEAVCDFGASVNIMPKVIYEKINGDTFIVHKYAFAACRSVTLLP